MLFVPGVAVGFMAACRDTIAGKPVFPTILIDGFRSYGSTVAKQLLVLGGIYVVAMLLVLAASAFVDGGALLRLMTIGGALDAESLENSDVPLAVLASLLCYVPVSMLFWFAPVLTAWHDVPPVKAMFFSIVSCWRNKGAFMVFGALWFAVSTVVSKPYCRYDGAVVKFKSGLQFTVTKRPPRLSERAMPSHIACSSSRFRA